MNAPSFIYRTSDIAGLVIRSVVAHDEPESNFINSLTDLASALPTPQALALRNASLSAAITTPNFHPGKPIPVGVVANIEGAVLPHMIGSDIGYRMRMIVLKDVSADQLSTRFWQPSSPSLLSECLPLAWPHSWSEDRNEGAKQSSRVWLQRHFFKTTTHSNKIGSVYMKGSEPTALRLPNH